MKESIGVTLLSGGLDSTTVTAYARDQVRRLTALTLLYGQTHAKEVEYAKEVSRLLGVEHRLVDISSFAAVAWYSSLTHPDQFPVPAASESAPDAAEAGATIPITYVPLRNSFFLTMAAALLESQALYAIETDGLDPRDIAASIFMAPNVIDYSGYPDCRPEYYEKIAEALMYGSKMWTQYRVPILIETPIIHLSKAEIVKLGMKLQAPLEYTWSCYRGGELPCGTCDSCTLRAKGFSEAGHEDPLLARLAMASR